MNDRLPRPWFQLHLSTCVLLTITASVLFWLNLRVPILEETIHDKLPHVTTGAYGWPWKVTGPQTYIHTDPETARQLGRERYLGSLPCWMNISFALILLQLVAFACEYFIRRRKRATMDLQRLG